MWKVGRKESTDMIVGPNNKAKGAHKDKELASDSYLVIWELRDNISQPSLCCNIA